MKQNPFIYLNFCIGIILLIFIATNSMAATSIVGPTGLVRVPSPLSVGKEKFEIGIHGERYAAAGTNGEGSYFTKVQIVGNYGVTDKFEIGFEKTFDTQKTFEDPDIV
ncbi:MAG: hypothetical protein ACTSQY_11830, partial [Candidatus Odinarchaeia archaeon]